MTSASPLGLHERRASLRAPRQLSGDDGQSKGSHLEDWRPREALGAGGSWMGWEEQEKGPGDPACCLHKALHGHGAQQIHPGLDRTRFPASGGQGPSHPLILAQKGTLFPPWPGPFAAALLHNCAPGRLDALGGVEGGPAQGPSLGQPCPRAYLPQRAGPPSRGQGSQGPGLLRPEGVRARLPGARRCCLCSSNLKSKSRGEWRTRSPLSWSFRGGDWPNREKD